MDSTMKNTFELMNQMIKTFSIDQIKNYLELKVESNESSSDLNNQIKKIEEEMKQFKM
jgi:hypothetical protein